MAMRPTWGDQITHVTMQHRVHSVLTRLTARMAKVCQMTEMVWDVSHLNGHSKMLDHLAKLVSDVQTNHGLGPALM